MKTAVAALATGAAIGLAITATLGWLWLSYGVGDVFLEWQPRK
jgi:hypothetical protein